MRILEQIHLSHIESIEILRGPEATSYGLGSGDGVILIRTK
jgi:TonB-dependent SusC/RagA subfamily outer membrane receptor